jgi:hypothetical protein
MVSGGRKIRRKIIAIGVAIILQYGKIVVYE